MISLFANPDHDLSVSRSPNLRGVEVLRGVHRGLTARWHLVPMVQVLYNLEGSARVFCSGERCIINPGDCIVNAPDCNPRIDERLTESGRTLRVLIAPDVFDFAARGTRLPPARALDAHVLAHSGLALVMDQLARAVEQRLPAAESQAALLRLMGVVDEALRSKQTSPAPLRREEVESARRILHQRFDRPVSLNELTRETGMSKFHLLRMFRRQVGTTPHAYQIHLRISRARELLDQGLAAAEVAMRCGFADQAHFSRCFKRIVGYSPRAFARNVDGGGGR